MKASRTTRAAAAAALLLAGAQAQAQNSYLELGAGRSKVDVDCAGTTRCEDSATAARLTAGYAFTPNWAAELVLADLGRIEAAGNVAGVGNVEARARLRSVGVGIAGSWPLADALSFTARLGIASNRTRISGTALGQSASDSESNSAAYGGLALNYAFAPAWSTSLTLDRTQAEYQGEKTDVTSVGLALRFRF